MLYRSYLILFIILLIGPGQCFAQEKYYRVEILVLTHLRHESEPLKVDHPRDYSNSLDFLLVPEPDETTEEEQPEAVTAAEPVANAGADALTISEDGAPLPDEEVDPWADVIPIETRSDVMQEAWRRLRLSAPFRPQQYLSWVQSGDEPFPLLRIHNQEIVLIDDPYAEERAALALAEEDEADTIVFSDQGQTLPDDPEADAEPELPDPTLYYELDGTVKLTRTRFLHLELDLEMRIPQFEPRVMDEQPLSLAIPDEAEDGPPRPTSFEVHKLQQSRQVKTDRMEYFDGPVIGVLAYITPFDPETQADLQNATDE